MSDHLGPSVGLCKIVLALAWVMLSGTQAFAAKWNCTEPKWISPPTYSSGLLKAAQESTCEISETTGHGFQSLEKFIAVFTESSLKKHAGPVHETYLGLPSVFYDVTQSWGFHSKKDWDQIGPPDLNDTPGSETWDNTEIRSEIHIATDNADQLWYVSESKKTVGTGNGAYVKKVDFKAHVTVLSATAPIAYSIWIENLNHISKPWYAPPGKFIDEAKKQATLNFKRQRDTLVPQVAASL